MYQFNLNRPTTFYLIASTFLFSCNLVRETHEQANISIDRATMHNTGPSFGDDDALGTPGENVGYLIGEAFATSGGAKNSHETGLRAYHLNNPVSGKNFLPGNEDYYFVAAPKENYFSLSEGLVFIGKGGGDKVGGDKSTVHIYYLKLPVMANYNFNVGGGDNYIHAGLGPYAAAALFGHIKTSGGEKISLHFGNDVMSDDYKRMDYGLTFGAGYTFLKHWDVSLGYDLGLRNVFPGNEDDKTRTRTLSLNIGYIFK